MLLRLLKTTYPTLLFFSVINVLVNFSFNIYLPLRIGLEKYGQFRYVFAVIAFSGIFHLGYLDGYFLLNARHQNKFSISFVYLFLLTSTFFFLFSLFLSTFIFFNFSDFIWLYLIVICATFINGIVLLFQLQNQFLCSVIAQIVPIISIILLLQFELFKTYFQYNIFQSIFFLYFFQILLLLTNCKTVYTSFFKLGLPSLNYIKLFHQKGLYILVIGLLTVGFLNIDKLILKNLFSAYQFGQFAFSNSIMLSLLGISFSLSNKLIMDFTKLSLGEIASLYRSIVSGISFIGAIFFLIALLIKSFFSFYYIEFSYLIEFLDATVILFPYLLIVILLHSNFSKLFSFEKVYLFFYLLVFTGTGLVVFLFSFDIHLMSLGLAILFYFSIISFDYLVLRPICKFSLFNRERFLLHLPLLMYVFYFLLNF
jgi:hypothetical protein